MINNKEERERERCRNMQRKEIYNEKMKVRVKNMQRKYEGEKCM